MAHDQTFKDVLRGFFHEFLTLFMPAIADGIDADSITFLDPQTFTDVPEGLMRTADLVAEARTFDGAPELVLLHTEAQTEPEFNLGYRMWEYNALLTLRRRRPAISALLLPFSGRGGVRKARYVETLFGEEYIKLEYWRIELPSLSAEDYTAGASILGVALAALMRPGPSGRAELKIAIIRRLRESGLDEARLFLLVNVVETYLTLDEAEQVDYRARLQQEEGSEDVEATELTWADRMRQQGREQGIEQGREQGIEQGALRAKHEIVVRLAGNRFGALPDDAQTRLAAANVAALDRLLDRLLQTTTLDEWLASLIVPL